MSHPNLSFLVTRPEESLASGRIGPPTLIPTWGHAATAVDAYRIAGIGNIQNPNPSWCFTDTDAAGALGRLIDGPVRSSDDIEKAESALRAILLYDAVGIIVPCVKAQNGNLFSYQRFDKSERNEASFSGMNATSCYDYLMALEMVGVKQGEITGSTNRISNLVGSNIDDSERIYNSLIVSSSEIANAFPMDVGAATYFSRQEFQKNTHTDSAGFIDEMYRRIHQPWMEIAQSAAPLSAALKMPPFVAIILSRAPSRADIPAVLAALREELAPARASLNRLNQMLDETMTQADLNAQVRRINESFDAIVPEALLTDTERRKRSIASVFRFTKPILKLFSIATNLTAADPCELIDVFNSTQDDVRKSTRLISRSVAAAKFAELLRVESFRGMMTSHFSKEEISRMRFPLQR